MSETSSMYDKVHQAKQSSDRIPKFIKIMSEMIEDSRYQEYLGWSHDGCALLIKKPVEFAETALPIFFKHNNFSSFVRQLNLYGFKKKKCYPFDNAFAHPMFKKGQNGLLVHIKRKGNDKGADLAPEIPICHLQGDQDTNSAFIELNRQNARLKKIHQDLTGYVEKLEEKAEDLDKENQTLQVEFEKKAQNVELLKNVFKQLNKIFGAEEIKSMFRSVIGKNQDSDHRRPGFKDTNAGTISREGVTPLNERTLKIQLAKADSSGISEGSPFGTRKSIDYYTKLKIDNSTPSNDTNIFVEDEQMEVKQQENNSKTLHWNFHNGRNLELQLGLNRNESRDSFFDGNLNGFENGFHFNVKLN